MESGRGPAAMLERRLFLSTEEKKRAGRKSFISMGQKWHLGRNQLVFMGLGRKVGGLGGMGKRRRKLRSFNGGAGLHS